MAERFGSPVLRPTGVVIFATNLAANFDPAFERRIRTHVLFELPGETERAQIWKVQLHPSRTPLAPDVDFNALAHHYEVSGGDIQNAVLKAALAAAAEPIPDSLKKIHQRHFQAGIEEVVASKRVMQQSIFAEPTVVMPEQDVITPATAPQASQLLAYGISGAALLVALVRILLLLPGPSVRLRAGLSGSVDRFEAVNFLLAWFRRFLLCGEAEGAVLHPVS